MADYPHLTESSKSSVRTILPFISNTANGNPQYYAQVQLNMLVTGTALCDFISYSPLYRKGMDLHILEIPKDEEYCKVLMERIEISVNYIKEQVSELTKLHDPNED